LLTTALLNCSRQLIVAHLDISSWWIFFLKCWHIVPIVSVMLILGGILLIISKWYVLLTNLSCLKSLRCLVFVHWERPLFNQLFLCLCCLLSPFYHYTFVFPTIQPVFLFNLLLNHQILSRPFYLNGFFFGYFQLYYAFSNFML
jgi:hypothetical protein